MDSLDRKENLMLLADERLLTIKEVSLIMQCDAKLVTDLTDFGILSFYGFGNNRKVLYSTLKEMLKQYEGCDFFHIASEAKEAIKKKYDISEITLEVRKFLRNKIQADSYKKVKKKNLNILLQ